MLVMHIVLLLEYLYAKKLCNLTDMLLPKIIPRQITA